jgi:outer membrane protein TolC
MFQRRLAILYVLLLCLAARAVSAQALADGVQAEPAAVQLGSFAQAKRLMAAHQPSLQLQAAALARAQAQVEQALSQLLPRLELGLGADYAFVRRPLGSETTRVFDGRSFAPSATASLSITFSLARLSQIDGAQLQVDADRRGLMATRHQLIGALAGSVLSVLSAERVAARNADGFAAAQERMHLTQRLLEVGRVTAIDALRFSQDLSEAQSELVSAVEALSEAREALGVALGVREAVGIVPELDVQALLPQVGSDCRAIADLSARADRQTAQLRVDQAQAAADSARLAYLPELRLTTLYSARMIPSLEVRGEGAREVVNDWGARANLVWTVYDGGQRSADVLRADAEISRLRAEQEQVVIDSTQERRRSQRLVSVTRIDREAAQTSVNAARRIDQLSRKALELGSATALEVVDAARRLRAVEITLALREVEELSAQANARLALAICE